MSKHPVVDLSEADARHAAKVAGFEVRVISRDGSHGPVRLNLRLNRINLEVLDGRVTRVDHIG